MIQIEWQLDRGYKERREGEEDISHTHFPSDNGLKRKVTSLVITKGRGTDISQDGLHSGQEFAPIILC